MQAKHIIAVVLVLLPNTTAGECFCGENGRGFWYIPSDEINHDDWFLYPWVVVDIEPIYDMTSVDEPIVSCSIEFEFAHEAHPATQTYEFQKNDTLFYFGRWRTFAEFESLISDDCELIAS